MLCCSGNDIKKYGLTIFNTDTIVSECFPSVEPADSQVDCAAWRSVIPHLLLHDATCGLCCGFSKHDVG